MTKVKAKRIFIERINEPNGPNYKISQVEPKSETIGKVTWLNFNGERQFAIGGDMELSAGYDNEDIIVELTDTGAQIHL